MPSVQGKPENLKVVARCRPLTVQEATEGRASIVSVQPPSSLKVEPSKGDFSLDHAFGPSSTQDEVFDTVARPIIDACMDGYNGTIFAYGQTGSGKTFTMEGSDDAPGIMPRSFEYVAQRVAELSVACEYVVYLSFLEIYHEDVIDLLVKGSKGQPAKLEVKESKERGIYVNGLGQHVVHGAADMMKKLALGKRNRKVGETKMNTESSRSHSILTLTLVRVEGATEAAAVAAAAVAPAAKGAAAAPGAPKPKKPVGKVSVGKLHLVDLAGSERASKTGAVGERLKEGIAINKSLSALGNVMGALVEGKSGALVPYRESKLTRLLQDSLGGNSKTVMVANVGPADWNVEETLSTLKYATRARSIKNAPKVNDDPADAMVQQYREQVEKLHGEYREKIAKLEEQHATEVKQLKEELQAIQAAKAAQSEETARVAALTKQLDELQAERARRQQQEQEVEQLRAQLAELAVQAAAAAAAEAAAAAAAGGKPPAAAGEEAAAEPLATAAAEAPSAPAAAARDVAAAPLPASAFPDSPSSTSSSSASRKQPMSSGRYQKEIAALKSKISQMQVEAIGDYQSLLEQGDELARVRAKMLEEAGRRTQADEELVGLQAQLAGVQGLSASQAAELRRMQELCESLRARGVRPRTPHMNLEIVIQGDGTMAPAAPQQQQQQQETGGNGRSLREDPGCNMLFEELVLELGYEAEAARQAIMAMPGGTMEEITDYILDKEAVFKAWRKFKKSLMSAAA